MTINVLPHSKLQIFEIQGKKVWVKREDLCTNFPAPPFSKVRGLYPHLNQLKSEGISTVGYTETSISMAGWGVAWVCAQLGLRAVIFDPQYKQDITIHKFHRRMWKYFGAEIEPIPAGRAKVNWYLSRKILSSKYPEGVLLPLGLPLKETVMATAEEVKHTMLDPFWPEGGVKSVVVCVGSGTIAAGILLGFTQYCSDVSVKIYGVMSRTGNAQLKNNFIQKKAGVVLGGLIGSAHELYIIDEGWQYTEKSQNKSPFPCHPYYDLKAWGWLCRKLKELESPILFWNIGSLWEE